MTPEIERHSAEFRREGPRRFSHWDAAAFDAVLAGPALVLCDQMRGQADAEAVLDAYLRLAQEAAGIGLLRPAATGPIRGSFLERCLVELIPALLPRVPAGERLSALARAWNLGEGLRRQPSWLDR